MKQDVKFSQLIFIGLLFSLPINTTLGTMDPDANNAAKKVKARVVYKVDPKALNRYIQSHKNEPSFLEWNMGRWEGFEEFDVQTFRDTMAITLAPKIHGLRSAIIQSSKNANEPTCFVVNKTVVGRKQKNKPNSTQLARVEITDDRLTKDQIDKLVTSAAYPTDTKDLLYLQTQNTAQGNIEVVQPASDVEFALIMDDYLLVKLNREKKELEQKIKTLNNTNTSIRQTLGQKSETLVAEKDTLVAEKKLLEQQIATLTTENTNLKEQNTNLNQELTNKSIRLGQEVQGSQDKSKKINSLNQKIKTLTTEKKQLEQQIDLNNRNDTRSENEQTTQIQELKQQISELTTQKLELKRTITAKAEENEALGAQLGQKSETLAGEIAKNKKLEDLVKNRGITPTLLPFVAGIVITMAAASFLPRGSEDDAYEDEDEHESEINEEDIQ